MSPAKNVSSTQDISREVSRCIEAMMWNGRYPPKPWGSGKTDLSKRDVSDAEFEWVNRARFDFGVPIKSIKEQTMLSQSTVVRWGRRWGTGVRTAPTNGRPRDVDDNGKQWLGEQIEKLAANGECPQRAQVASLVLEASKMTAKGQNRAPKVFVSKKQLQKVISELGLNKENAEITTEARKVATRDPLSFVSTSALFYWFFRMVPNRNLLWNYDAMTFAVGSMDPKKVEVFTMPNRDQSKTLAVVPKVDNWPSCSMRWYNLNSAAGGVGTLVFLFKWPEMKEEDFQVFEVAGLTSSTDMLQNGYVVFTKDGQGNLEFHKWYAVRIVGALIVCHQDACGETLNEQAGVLCDGEDTQIAAYADKGVVDFFNDHNIAVGKPPASTTGVTQSADAGHMHDDTRKKFTELMQDPSLPTRHRGLKNLLEHGIFAPSDGYWTSKRCNTAIHMLIAAKVAISRCCNMYKTVRSWEKIGIFAESGGYDLAQIAKQFSFTLSAQEYACMMEDLDRTRHTFKDRGGVSDQWLKENFRFLSSDHVRSRIVNARVPRDELTLSRQRSVFLLTPAVVGEQVQRRLRLEQVAKERVKNKVKKMRTALQNAQQKPSQKRKPRRNDADVMRVDQAEAPLDEVEAREANYLQNAAKRRREK
jgi:hypothetical protein